MKKALPWIIVGVVIIVIILFLVKRKKQRTSSAVLTPEPLDNRITVSPPVAPTGLSEMAPPVSSGGSVDIGFSSVRCECERDPNVQRLLSEYNSATNMFSKAAFKNMIEAECPCLTYLI